MFKQKLAHFPIGQLIIGTHVVGILLGTALLMVPQAQAVPIAFLDLLFTATSATCVTGLFTIPLSNFTWLGKAIILLLIQLGGLGLITLTLFFISLVLDVGLTGQFIAEKLLEIDSWKKIRRLLFYIIGITASCELLGALMLLPTFLERLSPRAALFHTVFHAVSSFCNAGVTILPHELLPYVHNYPVQIVTMALIFIGGLGFVTWYEIFEYLKTVRAKRPHRFSLHSKIILYGSAALIASTALLFWILEHNSLLANASIGQVISISLFHAISFRSTGFMLYPLGQLQLATLLLIMVVSFIGSSPGSTGSGIKITTFAIFLATIKSAISGKTSVNIKGRRISTGQVYRTVSIVAISLGWIALTTFCLLITENGWEFLDALFEACAAFTTFGTSTGVTPRLSIIGKLFIIVTMIVGRIGSLSLLLAIKLRRTADSNTFTYPEERVMLG